MATEQQTLTVSVTTADGHTASHKYVLPDGLDDKSNFVVEEIITPIHEGLSGESSYILLDSPITYYVTANVIRIEVRGFPEDQSSDATLENLLAEFRKPRMGFVKE